MPDGAAPFDAFCAVYPRKEGRAAAKKEYIAARARGVSFDTIMDGARRYAAAKAHADPNWLKFPATWLREECWLEDPQPPRRTEPKPERAPRASKANGKAALERAATESPFQALARAAGLVVGERVRDIDSPGLTPHVGVGEIIAVHRDADDGVEIRWPRETCAYLEEHWCFLEVVGNGKAEPERAPRASKANGKAAPVEPVEPDDDVEEEYYPGPEQLFPTGSCVWRRSDGRKGEVLSARDPGGLYYSVQVRWESGGIMWTSDDQLADEDPFTPEQRAEMAKREAEEKAAAEAEIAKREEEARAEREARAKREAEDRAESERRRKELLERFPIGARVDLIVSKTDKNGEVVKVMSRGVEVRWEGGWTSIVFPGQIDRGHLVLRPSEGAGS